MKLRREKKREKREKKKRTENIFKKKSKKQNQKKKKLKTQKRETVRRGCNIVGPGGGRRVTTLSSEVRAWHSPYIYKYNTNPNNAYIFTASEHDIMATLNCRILCTQHLRKVFR